MITRVVRATVLALAFWIMVAIGAALASSFGYPMAFLVLDIPVGLLAFGIMSRAVQTTGRTAVRLG